MQMILESLWLAMKAAQSVISATPSIGIDNGSNRKEPSRRQGAASGRTAASGFDRHGREDLQRWLHVVGRHKASRQLVRAHAQKARRMPYLDGTRSMEAYVTALTTRTASDAMYASWARLPARRLFMAAMLSKWWECRLSNAAQNSSCQNSCCNNPRAGSLPFERVSSLISVSMKRLLADVALHDRFAAVAR